jgi:transcriptional regulator with XRE-family HTH domain
VKLTLRKKFGLKVAALRKEAKVSQEALADRCGLARSYMSRIERGNANPSLDAIEILAGGLKVPVRKFFEE